MRLPKINKQMMKYALLIGEEPVYILDENGNKIVDYVDSEGNVYYRETGETQKVYSLPVEMEASVSFSGGEAQAQEYGIDVGQYDAVLITKVDEYPITETSVLWMDSEVEYTDSSKTHPNANKADFRVLAVKPSLNYQKVILGRIVK